MGLTTSQSASGGRLKQCDGSVVFYSESQEKRKTSTMSASRDPVDAAIEAVLKRLKVTIALKSEQQIALKAFIKKRDVFCVLPTGFGKSLIYQLVPHVLKEMGMDEKILIVISPLLALMDNQIKEAAKFDLTALQIGVHNDSDIMNGQCSLVFGTPEAWILNDKWRNMLHSDIYREKVFGIVVDEVHMTYKW